MLGGGGDGHYLLRKGKKKKVSWCFVKGVGAPQGEKDWVTQ